MTYTRAEHEAKKAPIQTVLTLLLDVAKKTGLEPNSKKKAVTVTQNGLLFELRHTSPFETRGFVLVDIAGHEVLSIQYERATELVADSSQFNEQGEYLGVGHIQCSYDYRLHLRELAEVLRSLESTWKLVPDMSKQEFLDLLRKKN